MIKKNINYVILCLMLLIVSSLIYINKYEIKEFSTGEDPVITRVQGHLINIRDATFRERLQAARTTYNNYWSAVKAYYDDSATRLTNCPLNYDKFRGEIYDALVNHNNLYSDCSVYSIEEYLNMSLSTDINTNRTERVKNNCRTKMLNSNTTLTNLINDYTGNATPLDKCNYLNS